MSVCGRIWMRFKWIIIFLNLLLNSGFNLEGAAICILRYDIIVSINIFKSRDESCEAELTEKKD
jgi:hypothetical protein